MNSVGDVGSLSDEIADYVEDILSLKQKSRLASPSCV
jgi:hypothetical protein